MTLCGHHIDILIYLYNIMSIYHGPWMHIVGTYNYTSIQPNYNTGISVAIMDHGQSVT